MDDLVEALKRSAHDPAVIRKTLSARGKAQEDLFRYARQRRKEYFPRQEVEVRSVIEISNICRQRCLFCNISAYAHKKRYSLKREDILSTVEHIYQRKRRVLLLQSGENPSANYISSVCRCLEAIKKAYPDLTVILCLGNLSFRHYVRLRAAGAQRYILKFETSNPRLYRRIKPGDTLAGRVRCIELLQRAGFEVGTGNIIGLPGQTLDDIVQDLFFLSRFKLTMMSTTVFIPGECSAFADAPVGDLDCALNYMALMRILYPAMLIPTTSSLERLRRNAQYQGLMAGANTVTIHDGTPEDVRRYFPIYSTHRFTPGERHIKHIVEKARLRYSLP